MFLARMVFFRLHESPRYLVHAGRHQEALESLQLISRFNGSELSLELEDVEDRVPPNSEARAPFNTGERVPILPIPNSQYPPAIGETLFDAGADSRSMSSDQSGTKDYQSMDGSWHSALAGHSPITPTAHGDQSVHSRSSSLDSNSESKNLFSIPGPLRREFRRTNSPSMVSNEIKQCMRSVLPRWLRRPLLAWLDRISMVLSPKWFRTTILVWAVWFFMSLGVYLFFMRDGSLRSV